LTTKVNMNKVTPDSGTLRERIFFGLYALYEVCYYLFGVSSINSFFNTSKLTLSINLLVIIGLTFFVVTNKYTFNQILLVSISILLGLYAFLVVKLNVLLMGVMFMAAAKNVNLNRFIKKDFYLRTILLSMIILANRIGWIPSRTGLREGKLFTIVRDTLGFGQFNITGALIMICVLEYVYLNFGRLTSLSYQVITLVVVLTLVLTNSRGSMLAVILYVVASWETQYHLKRYKVIALKQALYSKYIFILFTLISTITVALFNYSAAAWRAINYVTSDRVNILNQYFHQFGISLLPQVVKDYRSAGIIVMDNIYVTLAIQYGVLILMMFVIYYYILCNNALLKGNIEFIILVVTLMIFGMIESTFFIPGINFTVMMVFANLTPQKEHKLRS